MSWLFGAPVGTVSLLFAVEAFSFVHEFLFVGVSEVSSEAAHREVHGYYG